MARKISDEELNINVKVAGDQARKQMADLATANASMTAENKKLLEQKKKLEKAGQKESQQYKELTQTIDKNKASIESNKQEHKELMKSIDNTQKSMKELRKDANILQRQLDQEIEGTQEYKRLQKELGATKQRMYEMRQETFEVQKAMGSTDDATDILANSLTDLFGSLKSGNLTGAGEAIGNIKGQLWGAVKASAAFIATPLGAALAVVAAIGAGIGMWVSYNKELTKYKKLVEGITGAEGDLSTEIANRSKALQEVYGVEMQESVTAADSLVKQFGISYGEAFDIIGESLDAGAVNNNEFFDSIKEYPTFFKSMGFSAEQLAKIINKGYDLKIYSDKLPDALKEADLSLREGTTATRDALVNAFGAPFANEILDKVKRGEITTSQALQRIKDKSDETQPDVQQQAQLTADIFRGAGEDVGGFAVIMDAVAAANDDVTESLTPLQEGMRELREATEDLEKAKSDALASNSWVELSQQFDIGWKKLQTLFYNSIDDVSEFFLDLKLFGDKWISGQQMLFRGFPLIIRAAFSAVKQSLNNLVNTFLSGGKIIESVLSLDFDTAIHSLELFKHNIEEEISGGFGLGKVVDGVTAAIEANNARLDAAREASKALAAQEAERRKTAGEDGDTTGGGNGLSKEDEIAEAIDTAVVKANAIIEVEDDFYKRSAALALESVKNNLDLKNQEVEGKRKLNEIELKNEQALTNAKLNVAKNAFGAIAMLLGEQTKAGKAAAIAMATINTYQGVTEVWKTPSTLPEPFATISKVASTATVLASGLKAVTNIKSQSTNVPGFEEGYYPWTQTVTRDDGKKYGAAYGGMTRTGIVSRPTVFTDYLAGEGHRKELIVDSRTFSRLDPSVVSHIQRAAHGITGYETGFSGNRATAAFNNETTTGTNNQEMTQTMEMLQSVLMRLDEKLNKPLQAVTQIGYQEASDIAALNDELNNSQFKARP